MPKIIIVLIILALWAWSGLKKSYASHKADEINANRDNPYRPKFK